MGRCFLRRLFNLLRDRQHKRNHDLFRIPAEAYRDLVWWQKYAEQWNGISLIPATSHPTPFHCYTDACLKAGAAICDHEWFYVKFPDSFEHPIAVKEFHIVLLALQTWGPKWKGKPAIFTSTI